MIRRLVPVWLMILGLDFLFAAYPSSQGFFRIFGNIPISFSCPGKGNDPDKDESRVAHVSVLTCGWSSKAASSFNRSFFIPCSWGDVPEADSEEVPLASWRRLRSCFFDDGPRSEIREGDLANMRSKYAIYPSVAMRRPTEFERSPDGGAGEVAVYEVYLEAGFPGVIPSLIGEVSSFFGFCPSQLTPLTWRTSMAIQWGSITFDPVMSPLWSKNPRGVSGAITPLGMVGTAEGQKPKKDDTSPMREGITPRKPASRYAL
ncbi:hypothetical protein Bca101_100991 [Brassica carinata]